MVLKLIDNPDIVNLYSQRDTQLYDRLKSVYLTSSDPEEIVSQYWRSIVYYKWTFLYKNYIFQKKTRKTLPLSKERVEDFELGIKEPETVPPGHMTLRSALKFFTDHHINKLPVKDLEEKYGIDEKKIGGLGFKTE